jgi:hypothetical protein
LKGTTIAAGVKVLVSVASCKANQTTPQKLNGVAGLIQYRQEAKFLAKLHQPELS